MEQGIHDLIVIGAGICGIAAARFYLETHPQSRVLILERDICPGGTWNSRRSYYGFYTQWSLGAAEFSDMPMESSPEGDTYMGFFKAKYTTQYLENYVDYHSFSGQSLRDRILFRFSVRSVIKEDGLWIVSGNELDRPRMFLASKLVVASGPTSEPNRPRIRGEENFGGPILHQELFGESEILSSTSIENVAVLGGGKSAADMVYACVKAGKRVSWIIRKSGNGPGYLFPPEGEGPCRNAFELGGVRASTIATPSIYNNDTYLTRFLQKPRVGNWLINAIWGSFEKQMMDQAKYEGRKDAKPGFSQLKPNSPFFWMDVTGGLLNRPGFLDIIAPNVDIYHEDILEVDCGCIRLQGGTEIPAQALLLGTGWLSSFTFFDPDYHVKLGLPHALEKGRIAADSETWSKLEEQADREILAQMPILRNPPPHKPPTRTPYRLYKGIAPLDDNSIAFVGFTEFLNYFRGAECQSIWVTAFLDGKLKLPSREKQMAEIARTNVYCRRRYLSSGQKTLSEIYKS